VPRYIDFCGLPHRIATFLLAGDWVCPQKGRPPFRDRVLDLGNFWLPDLYDAVTYL